MQQRSEPPAASMASSATVSSRKPASPSTARLAGRAAVICPAGLADRAVPAAIAGLYAPHAVICSDAEHAAFVGNCIALSADTVWMSAAADAALRDGSRALLRDAGFDVRSVPLDAIEAGGGSLRCCIGEIY